MADDDISTVSLSAYIVASYPEKRDFENRNLTTMSFNRSSLGVGIVFTREVGAMKKKRADEICGQGLMISISIGLISALAVFFMQDMYFASNGITGDILNNALQYYRFLPLNAFLTIVIFYLEQMVYSDGDEFCNNLCYVFQIGGNIILSVVLTNFIGMTGIILGSVIGNGLGILVCCWHYFRKGNSLHFVWHLSFKDFLLTSGYSIVDSSVYLCRALMDYVMIGFVSNHYGTAGLITLAVVVSLIEFSVVMDGVGMALQPLIGTCLEATQTSGLWRRIYASLGGRITSFSKWDPGHQVKAHQETSLHFPVPLFIPPALSFFAQRGPLPAGTHPHILPKQNSSGTGQGLRRQLKPG